MFEHLKATAKITFSAGVWKSRVLDWTLRFPWFISSHFSGSILILLSFRIVKCRIFPTFGGWTCDCCFMLLYIYVPYILIIWEENERILRHTSSLGTTHRNLARINYKSSLTSSCFQVKQPALLSTRGVAISRLQRSKAASWVSRCRSRSCWDIQLTFYGSSGPKNYWLIGGIPTPLKNMNQIGFIGSSSQLLGKIKNVPNHQPAAGEWMVNVCTMWGPPVISWLTKAPVSYSYKYHKT